MMVGEGHSSDGKNMMSSGGAGSGTGGLNIPGSAANPNGRPAQSQFGVANNNNNKSESSEEDDDEEQEEEDSNSSEEDDNDKQGGGAKGANKMSFENENDETKIDNDARKSSSSSEKAKAKPRLSARGGNR